MSQPLVPEIHLARHLVFVSLMHDLLEMPHFETPLSCRSADTCGFESPLAHNFTRRILDPATAAPLKLYKQTFLCYGPHTEQIAGQFGDIEYTSHFGGQFLATIYLNINSDLSCL